MPNVITTIRATTEVEAVNVMLGAIGEAPLAPNTDLSAATDTNVEMAIGILRETVREVLAAGWRFNTLSGYELAPTAQYAWVDTDGVSTTLNVFKLPASVLAWKPTPCSENLDLNLVEFPSLKYTESGQPVNVLFDRVKNRDGAEASRYPFIYIDPVFARDFVQLPEEARRYATVVAARRFCGRVPASESQAAFTQADEFAALRVLKRAHGLQKRSNLFQTADAWEQLGRRDSFGGGYSVRVFPGGA
jgi:hypothetical protein